MERVFLGVDIGGSHIGVGIVSECGDVLESCEVAVCGAELSPAEAVCLIVSQTQTMLTTLASKGRAVHLVAAGVGCPGQAFDGVLVAASNLPKFQDVSLAQSLSDALGGVAVALLNDADAAISAEVWGTQGVYDGFSNLAMLTLGTGVGLGLILDGALYQGSFGLVEGGHMIVSSSADSRRCGCGQRGCVEAYSSAANTARRLEELDGLGETGLTGRDVFERYAAENSNAVAVVEETAEKLATACINICRVVDPQVIILGGGLAGAGDALLVAVYRHLHAQSWTVLPTRVRLLLSQSNNGGVVGAALAAQNKFSKHKIGHVTVGAQNAQIECRAPNTRWLGAAVAVSSTVALLLCTQRSSSSTARVLRDALLATNIAFGAALFFVRK